MSGKPTPTTKADDRLSRAVEDFMSAYRAAYSRPSTGGIRDNAPMRAEVAALNAVWREVSGT